MKKRNLLLLALLCFLSFNCSDDSDKISYEDLEIETKDGYISKPEWLRNVVRENMVESGHGKLFLPGYVKAILFEKETFILVENMVSSNSCVAWQLYKKDGEQIPCDSKLYQKILKSRTDKTREQMLWNGMEL